METIRIQDDLYTYVNQETLDKLVIPEDKPYAGGFAELAEGVEKIMMGEFEAMAESKDYPNDHMKRACELYTIAKDVERKERFGISPALKLLSTLEDMADTFGADRPISLCRELTKLHEEVVRTTLGAALEACTAQPPKGEFVLVVAGAPVVEKEAATAEDAVSRVKELMAQGISRKDAVKQTAKELDLPKNVVYDAALRMDEE